VGDDKESAEQTDTAHSADDRARNRALMTARVRGQLARVVWVVCLVIALVLAAAAFSYALDANAGNSLIKLIRQVADHTDLGWFDLDNPIWEAKPPNALTKTALANYGIAAVVYLVVGRVLERVIRP